MNRKPNNPYESMNISYIKRKKIGKTWQSKYKTSPTNVLKWQMEVGIMCKSVLKMPPDI